MIGAGAANVALARLLILTGAKPGNLILVDSRGTLHKNRTDLELISPKSKELENDRQKQHRLQLFESLTQPERDLLISSLEALLAACPKGTPDQQVLDWIQLQPARDRELLNRFQ
jgi:malic enzyme